MNETASPEDWDLALARCAEERIQLIGQVQADFVLLAIDLALERFTYLSANAGEVFGIDFQDLKVSKPTELIGEKQLPMIKKRAQSWNGRGARLIEIQIDGKSIAAWAHLSAEHLVIEIDTRMIGGEGVPEAWDWEDLLRESLNHVENCADLPAKLQAVVADTTRLGNFDRVMIYRFLEDGTGEVVAEQVRPDWEPYLGLRYPASDIPAQARQLFLKNDVRLIREVTAIAVPIFAVGGGTVPLDLSLSRFRQPSPIHLEYLRNMGVGASFVTAIVSDERLWGLISCHHGEALNLPAQRQVQLAALTNHLANDLAGMAREVRLRNELRCARITSKLIQCITVTDDWTSVLISMSGEICEIMRVDGLAIQFDGRVHAAGLAPSGEAIGRLVREGLEEGGGQEFHHCRQPGEAVLDWLPAEIGGFLSIPLSQFREDALILFRHEMTKKVTWAGEPKKSLDRSDGVARLKPRASFEAWKETVQGTCHPWSEEDLTIAKTIRQTLSDIVITAHYFRQSLESPAALRHRLAHEANSAPVAFADENGWIVFQNLAAVSDPVLGTLQSLDQLIDRMDLNRESVTESLRSLIHDEMIVRLPADSEGRIFEASRLTEENRLVGYAIRLIRAD